MSETSQATSYIQFDSETLRLKLVKSLLLEIEHDQSVSSMEIRNPHARLLLETQMKKVN